MVKKLSEMSLEELWQLYPIFLTEHQDCWKSWYADEEAVLKKSIPQTIRINHIGSTALNSIWAKPIIDILVEVPRECDLVVIKNLLIENGYTCMSQCADRISFNKGYTENGFAERVFHLHLRYIGDNDELYFRDYLIKHPAVSIEYEKLKLILWKEFEHDRDGYTNAKTEFIQKYTNEAKLEWQEAVMDYKIRTILAGEDSLLQDFLYEAIFVPEGMSPPTKSIINQPELQIYITDFGKKKDDIGLVAEVNRKAVGAVWVRIMNDYGHIDNATPSFAISLYKEYRGFGIGTALMKEMLHILKDKGYKQASLAVQKANYAVKMYQNTGFEIVDENEEEYIMLCRLSN